VFADRYNRKYLLIVTDLIRAVVVLGFLLVRDPAHVWLLYTLTAIQLGISGFFFPARNAMLPNVVKPEMIGAANALSSATWSVMLAIGTAIGGLVAGFFGVYTAFVVDALTFLVSAGIISLVGYEHRVELAEKTTSRILSALSQYIDGLRYLKQNFDVFLITAVKGAFCLTAVGGLGVIQVRLAEQVYSFGQGGGVGMGIIFAVVGVGTGIGPILGRYYTFDDDRRLRIAIGIGLLLLIAGIALMALLPSFAVLTVGLLLRGIGGGIAWVFSTQLLMQIVPDQFRGRVFATEFALFMVASALSASLAGFTIDLPDFGLSGTMWVMAGLTLIPTMLWIIYLRNGRRLMPATTSGNAELNRRQPT
jgi:MFS family permease